jgi:hypothetical protein
MSQKEQEPESSNKRLRAESEEQEAESSNKRPRIEDKEQETENYEKNDNQATSSLVDDYADPNLEFPNYTEGDD